MKILRSWLNDYVKTQGLTNDEIADLLTFSGTLVDDILGLVDEKVVAAKILEVKEHPNADRLHLALVTDGTENYDIVCGAPNIAAGQIVPLAKIGTKFVDFEIKEAVIRGASSFGMLCSEKELGISENHEGIMLLPEETKLGIPVNKILQSDAVFDIEITPNRGDCLSHIGVARELAAVKKEEIRFKTEAIQNKGENDFGIEILSPDKCFQYNGILIEDVKVSESPSWLKERLLTMGLSPINNVVDITNYIMFDLGQPLHAFDAEMVADKKIVVRTAEENEEFTTLDGQKRVLDKDMLLIADSKKALAIAGLMGGLDSGVTEKTTSILLESAEFEPVNIRKTSKKLNLSTEASYRFERGIDPEMTQEALDRAASMIVEICGGKVVAKKTEMVNNYENPWVKMEISKSNDLLGTELSSDEMKETLKRLGFSLKDDMAQAPSWRHDISIWQDLAEEVGRIYDFNNISKKDTPISQKPKSSVYHFKEHIKDMLVDNGFSEVHTYSFLSEKDLEALSLDKKDLLEVANPISPENKYLRNHLLPSLLRAVAKNPIFDSVLIFEIGNVFTTEMEETHLAIASSGKNARKMLENAISSIKQGLKIDEIEINISELAREDIARFKIKKPVTFTVEIPIKKLYENTGIEKDKIALKVENKVIHYRPVSRFPSITRDLAFIVDNAIEAKDITNHIYEQSELINRVELFDEFTSDKFGSNKKNIAYHVNLQHQERTLTDKEAEEVIENVIEKVNEKFFATLRNY